MLELEACWKHPARRRGWGQRLQAVAGGRGWSRRYPVAVNHGPGMRAVWSPLSLFTTGPQQLESRPGRPWRAGPGWKLAGSSLLEVQSSPSSPGAKVSLPGQATAPASVPAVPAVLGMQGPPRRVHGQQRRICTPLTKKGVSATLQDRSYVFLPVLEADPLLLHAYVALCCAVPRVLRVCVGTIRARGSESRSPVEGAKVHGSDPWRPKEREMALN